MSGVNKLEELHGIMPSHRLDHATRRSSCNPCKKSNRMLLGKKKKLPMSANRMVLYRRSRRCVARVVSRNLVVGTWLTDATVVELQRLLIFFGVRIRGRRTLGQGNSRSRPPPRSHAVVANSDREPCRHSRLAAPLVGCCSGA